MEKNNTMDRQKEIEDKINKVFNDYKDEDGLLTPYSMYIAIHNGDLFTKEQVECARLEAKKLLNFLQEIEAWLCLNTHPTLEQICEFKKDLRIKIKELTK